MYVQQKVVQLVSEILFFFQNVFMYFMVSSILPLSLYKGLRYFHHFFSYFCPGEGFESIHTKLSLVPETFEHDCITFKDNGTILEHDCMTLEYDGLTFELTLKSQVKGHIIYLRVIPLCSKG